MRKKILFSILAAFTFFITTDVFATVITCDYGKYILKFDTQYYSDGTYAGNNGNCDKEPLCFITKSEEKSMKYILYNREFIYDKKECPKQIYVESHENSFELSFSESELLSNYEIYKLAKVSCGNIEDIPKKIPELTSYAITIIQIAVPVILVIMGSIDLFKGITAQKEDEIKKGQQIFIKRLIVASLIFFIVVVVKLLISVIDNSSGDNIIDCIDCFISNDCD